MGCDIVRSHRYEHQGWLGTTIDVHIADAHEADVADNADAAVLAEIARLERVFSAFDPRSELCRWRRGERLIPSQNFAELMGSVHNWQVRSNSGFNPLAGEITELWRQAEALGSPPSEAALAAVVASIRRPRFEMVEGVPVASGDCSALNLHAIAKGYIVDRALEVVRGLGLLWVCVNAGGDLAHQGAESVRAGIENPHRPYDNEPPLTVIELANSALATSGSARRGFRVGGRWFGHVIDPRTGWPVEGVASISVVAADAMTADVLATVAGVLAPEEGIALLEETSGVEGMLVLEDEQQMTTTGWADLTIS